MKKFPKLKEEQLEAIASEALKQIDDKRYGINVRKDGIGSIVKYGIAFLVGEEEGGKHNQEIAQEPISMDTIQLVGFSFCYQKSCLVKSSCMVLKIDENNY